MELLLPIFLKESLLSVLLPRLLHQLLQCQFYHQYDQSRPLPSTTNDLINKVDMDDLEFNGPLDPNVSLKWFNCHTSSSYLFLKYQVLQL